MKDTSPVCTCGVRAGRATKGFTRRILFAVDGSYPLMEYVWLIVFAVVWTVLQGWVLPRLGVPT